MAEREPGFYRVKTTDFYGREDWIVAQWIVTSAGPTWWALCGTSSAFDDDYFAEIGERVRSTFHSGEAILTPDKRKMVGRLIVEAAMLWPLPQPITDAQKTGERFLVWVNAPEGRVNEYYHGWAIGSWEDGQWVIYMMGTTFMTTVRHHLVTHCYPLPPDVKPPHDNP